MFTDIIPSIWSDHSCILLQINHFENSEKGSGYWKMNNSLLKDNEYVAQMNSKLIEWKEELGTLQVKDKRVQWELIKYNIRKFTMSYSSVKKTRQIEK